MNIGFVTTPLTLGHAVRGIGFYTKRLLSALQKLTKTHSYSDIEVIPITNPLTAYSLQLTLIHYPYFDLFYPTLKIPKDVTTVVTVHDLIPLRYPNHYPSGIKGAFHFQSQIRNLKRAAAVITDSETSKVDIINYLKIPPAKISVIPLAPQFKFSKLPTYADKAKLRKKYQLPAKFVLYGGDVNWNKNIPSLIRACRKINTPLVIVGKQAMEINTLRPPFGPRDIIRKFSGRSHPQLAHLVDLKSLFADPLVQRLGFVPEEDLPGIYSLASVYCQPSFWEGFGLNPLEAQAVGCPVVSSDTPALKELLKDYAVYVNPLSVDNIAAGLERAITRPSKEMISLGRDRSSRFSWEQTAKITIGVYRTIV